MSISDIMIMGMAVAILLLVAIIALYRFAFKELNERFKHERKVASGNFKVKLVEKEWNAGVEAGCFAVAVKDQKTEKVVFTLMIEKEK